MPPTSAALAVDRATSTPMTDVDVAMPDVEGVMTDVVMTDVEVHRPTPRGDDRPRHRGR